MTQRPDLTRRVPELDGLRGLAILLVLAWHLLPPALADAPPRLLHLTNSVIRFGWSGVDLFFVLSGFLLGGILLDHRGSTRYFRTFYVRRFYRILPAYAVIVGIFLLLLGTTPSPAFAWLFEPRMPIWSYLTFTQNFAMASAGAFGAQWLGPTWSLAVEEQFYLMLPLVIRFVPRRALWIVLTIMAALAPVTRTALFLLGAHGGMSGTVLMPARADALMLGVLAALALRSPSFRATLDTRRPLFYGALAVLSLAIIGMAVMGDSQGSPRMLFYGYSVLALFYTTVLLLAVTADRGETLGQVLRWPVLRRTGTLAYAIYLLHVPLMGLVSGLIPSRAIAGAIAVAATFIGAAWSWEYFEKPFVERGHRHHY